MTTFLEFVSAKSWYSVAYVKHSYRIHQIKWQEPKIEKGVLYVCARSYHIWVAKKDEKWKIRLAFLSKHKPKFISWDCLAK